MYRIMTHVGKGGRVVIPAEYRRALGIKPGDRVIISLDDGEMRIVTPRQAVLRAQAEVGRYVTSDRLLAEELIAERHAGADYD